MNKVPQMVRLSCRYQEQGRPCNYRITIEAGLEDWGKEVIRKHVVRKHPERIVYESTKANHEAPIVQTATAAAKEPGAEAPLAGREKAP
jgi:hypothetical protein